MALLELSVAADTINTGIFLTTSLGGDLEELFYSGSGTSWENPDADTGGLLLDVLGEVVHSFVFKSHQCSHDTHLYSSFPFNSKEAMLALNCVL